MHDGRYEGPPHIVAVRTYYDGFSYASVCVEQPAATHAAIVKLNVQPRNGDQAAIDLDADTARALGTYLLDSAEHAEVRTREAMKRAAKEYD